MKNWRYFKRTVFFGGKPIQIYRIPANGKSFAEQSPIEVEKLHRDGIWAYDPDAVDGIWRELFLGGFSERTHELSESQVAVLFEEWQKGGWPRGM